MCIRDSVGSEMCIRDRQMYEQIIEEQEFARQVRKKQLRDEEARRWLQRDKRIELVVEIAATAILFLLLAAIAVDLRQQTIERSNFWRASSYTLPSLFS
jgi:hypothetical protein